MNPENHTEPDDFQQAWQSQTTQTRVTVDADLLLKIVQRDQQNFRSVMRVFYLATVGFVVLMIPLWFYLGHTVPSPWTWYLAVPVLIWWVALPVVYRMRHKPKQHQPHAPLVECVEQSLIEMDDEIWLQRNSFWLNGMPLAVAMIVFAVHSAWLRSSGWLDFLGHMDIVIFFLAVFYFIYLVQQYIQQHAASSELELRRQELQTLLSGLKDEPTGEDATSINSAIEKPSRGFAGRFAIAGGAVLLAILIALVSDPPFQRTDPLRVSEHYTKRSPFSAVRWRESEPDVQLGVEWFKLVSLDGVLATEIVAFSQATFADRWQKRFEEDLVELLSRMGHPPKDTVTLKVQSLTSGDTIVRQGVPMTEANRQAIWDAAQSR